MDPRLTRGEYWLLETVVTSRYPMSYLCSERYSRQDGLEQVFNKTGHGLGRDRLIRTLVSLIREGLLETRRDGKAYFLDEFQVIAALDEKRPLENLKNPADWTYYGLTSRGATAWEAFAAPEWDRFILDDSLSWLQDQDWHPGSATCLSRGQLQRYLKGVYLAGYEIDSESVKFVECGEWTPTYWKVLPSGYQARFQWRMGTPRPQDEFHRFAFEGFCAFQKEWYHWG